MAGVRGLGDAGAPGGDAALRLDPAEPPERHVEKLLRINAALMRRVEQGADAEGGAYALFERAARLEAEVRARTQDLGRAVDLLNEANARLEAAGRETEAARADLAGAIEAVREGFALFDAGDRLVLCNARFGRDLPDLRPRLTPGLAFEDYVRAVSRSPHLALGPEAPEAWAARRLRAHASGHADFDVPLSGERWLQVSERRTATGGTVVLQTDVTGLLRMERAERDRLLSDQARTLRATLDHLAQGVLSFDEGARLVGWNRHAAGLLSLPAGTLRHGVDLARIAEVLGPEAGPLLGEPRSAEIRRAGRWIALAARAMPSGFLVTSTDVTAQREALGAIREANETLERRVRDRTIELEDALAVAERALATKSRFVAAASHDLLQPLSAAKLYLGSLEFGAEDPRAGLVTKAAGAMESVEAMLDALLHMGRLDSGASQMLVEEVALRPLLDRLRDEFAPSAEAKGIALRVVPSAAVVRSDATYLRRILQNLIANAVRYTEGGGVLVGVRRGGDGVRVEVLDTGPGIAEADLEAVFEEFRRLRAGGEGMGLGLAIVERACGLLGHPLEVTSEPGRGTRFAVGLPLAEARRPLVLLVGAGAGEPARLEAVGCDVIEAADAAEAEALMEQLGVAPDLALTGCPMVSRCLAPLPCAPMPGAISRAAIERIARGG
jgi:signal transduction histidine kinase